MPRLNTNCTNAMTGMKAMNGDSRCGYSSMIPASGISPKANPTTAAVLDATGRTSFGNWIWRISDPWLVTACDASVTVDVNHFQGRIAERMNRG